MPIALCMTVLNEAASIDELFASIASQTRPPDQIVVVDGGSRDDTVERVARWERKSLPLLVMVHPGANISAGRNTAIASTDAELIAVTDGGVRLEPGWLAALAAAFERAERPDVACGFFVPEPRSVFELALGATTFPTPQEVRPESFLPSSRSVAFTRAAWRRVGGYPEWLDYCEDLVFDIALGLLCARRQRWLLGPIGLAAAAYLARPYRRLLPALGSLGPRQRARAIAWVPLIRLIGDVAKMLGYPAGVAWRVRRGVGRETLARKPRAG